MKTGGIVFVPYVLFGGLLLNVGCPHDGLNIPANMKVAFYLDA
jgi:hypothetical protein